MTNPIIERLQKLLDAEKIRITPIVRASASKWKVDLLNLIAKILNVNIVPDIKIEQLPHVPTNTPTTQAKPTAQAKAKRKK